MSVELLRTVVIVAVLGAAAPGHADPWYGGPAGKSRVVHVSVTLSLGLGFLTSETLIKPATAADHCRWCTPPGIDVSIRDGLVWDDVGLARTLSNLTGYVGAPAIGIGITALTAATAEDASWARVIDDTLPVLETLAVSEGLTQLVKFAVARQRPFVRYTKPAANVDDNLSFWSGHSVLAFGAVTSAGMVAHWRQSKLEPVIWGVGLPLAVATAYLRIAGDKHYFTDVVVGSAIGVASGLTIPRLMRRAGVVVVPAPTGVSVAGAF